MNDYLAINLEGVLAPLTGLSQCGDNLQYDDDYSRIRLDRMPDNADFHAGHWQRKVKKIDWSAITGQCVQLLSTRSKDLQVAAWLTESLVYGFKLQGLTQGLHAFVELNIKFWEGVHPELEPEDPSLRLRPTIWLLRELQLWIITGVLQADDTNISNENPRIRHYTWQAIRTDLDRLEAFLNEQLPDDAPSFSEIRQQVQAEWMASRPSNLSLVADSPPLPQSTLNSGANNGLGAPPMGGFQGYTRQRAYEQLDEIAAYLHRVEPHSPVPAVLRGLVSWRDATFEDLLNRLPKDGHNLYDVLKLFKGTEQS